MKVIAPELRLATCWDLFRAWIGYPQLHVFESGQDDDEYVYEALERHNQLRKVRAMKLRYSYTHREISSSLIRGKALFQSSLILASSNGWI